MGLLLCLVLVLFIKTRILAGHLGNRVRQEIVFTFGKGFKRDLSKTTNQAKLPVIVGCGYY